MNPCLLPNWDTLALKKLTFERRTNCFSLTSQLDFGGIGPRNVRTGAKHSAVANFHSLRPVLPFYVNNGRNLFNFASNNCLTSCRYEENDILVFSHENKIIGLSLEDNSLDDKNCLSKSHSFSSERAVTYGPFRYCTSDVTELYCCDQQQEQPIKPILGLKVYKCDDYVQQIQTNTRNKINFFEFSNEEECGLSLNIVCELDIESLERSDESMFELYERNEFIDNQMLISYTKDDVIDLYDLEKLETIRTFDSNCFHVRPGNQIGLNWSLNHPQMFYYGEHKKMVYCDVRQLRPAIKLFEFNKCDNLYEWELFFKFLPSKLNPNQVFVGTDYHIVVIDHRYPKRSLIQFKHMLPNQIIRCMDSEVIEFDDTQNEVMIVTNFYRNCLMSLSSLPNVVQLTLNHFPLHIANINEIDFYNFRNCFYRGIKVYKNEDFFSVALLSNVGDIFVQDFYWNNLEVIDRRQCKDVTWNRGVGSSELFIDPETVEYMTVIHKFLEEKNCQNLEDTERFDLKDECLTCLATNCKRIRGQCVCNEPKHLTELFEEENISQERKDEDFNYEKYFGEDFLEVFEKIENQELCYDLWEKSVDLSNELQSLWNTNS